MCLFKTSDPQENDIYIRYNYITAIPTEAIFALDPPPLQKKNILLKPEPPSLYFLSDYNQEMFAEKITILRKAEK